MTIQAAPLIGSTTATQSAAYSVQLNASGGVGPYSWSVTSLMSNFLVTSGGLLTPSGFLTIGKYSASGVVLDSLGASANWSFVLSVTATSGAYVISPVVSPEPTGWEVAVPFQFDATGAVALLQSFEDIMAQHVATIIMTAAQERLMLPGYGVGLEHRTFQPNDEMTLTLIIADIQAQVKINEPNVIIQSVTADDVPGVPTAVSVTVQYLLKTTNTVSTVTINTGGAYLQVTS